MTPGIFMGIGLALFVLIVAGVVLIFRVRGNAEKIMVTQIMATLCVAWLLVTAEAVEQRSLYDVGLVFALLASLTTIAFVNRSPKTRREVDHDPA